MEKKYLYGHTNFENAYEISNYPWGFRLKTERRYWIETEDKKNGGQRLCTCTKNPKNGLWCTPKKSTYNALMFMYLDENEYVQHEGCYDANVETEKLLQLVETHREYLSEYQIKTIKQIKAYKEVMKNVSWKCEIAPIRTEEEQKKHDEEQAKSWAQINYYIHKLSKQQTV